MSYLKEKEKRNFTERFETKPGVQAQFDMKGRKNEIN